MSIEIKGIAKKAGMIGAAGVLLTAAYMGGANADSQVSTQEAQKKYTTYTLSPYSIEVSYNGGNRFSITNLGRSRVVLVDEGSVLAGNYGLGRGFDYLKIRGCDIGVVKGVASQTVEIELTNPDCLPELQ